MIVVTGALGHIGSRLVRELDDVVMIDNLYTQSYYSLFNLGKHKFIQADIMDIDLYSIFKKASVVIHLAAIVDPENSYNQKELVDRINIDGTEKVALACAKSGCPMIFASTTSVYGMQDNEVDETCTGLKPQSPYAEAKVEAENILSEMKELKYTIIRMGTIFGTSPGMRFHTAVNKFCFQSAMGQPITVWRTALNQNRPYLDLSDMIRAVKFITEHNLYTNGIYNLVTVNTTVSKIIDIIKKKIPTLSINYIDTRIMSQLSYTISNQKFKNLGFEFKGDLAKGINETLDLLCR